MRTLTQIGSSRCGDQAPDAAITASAPTNSSSTRTLRTALPTAIAAVPSMIRAPAGLRHGTSTEPASHASGGGYLRHAPGAREGRPTGPAAVHSS
ncbi:hypothetical protein [Streptomyces sp. NPDC056227]|uniref:hypothetical protein n=1 Tax=Streptomyces sp. NPDC056227 TaxID=3345753 RepID=UPI0035DEBBF0